MYKDQKEQKNELKVQRLKEIERKKLAVSRRRGRRKFRAEDRDRHERI